MKLFQIIKLNKTKISVEKEDRMVAYVRMDNGERIKQKVVVSVSHN